MFLVCRLYYMVSVVLWSVDFFIWSVDSFHGPQIFPLSLSTDSFIVVAASTRWTLLHWPCRRRRPASADYMVRRLFYMVCRLFYMVRGLFSWSTDSHGLHRLSSWSIDSFCCPQTCLLSADFFIVRRLLLCIHLLDSPLGMLNDVDIDADAHAGAECWLLIADSCWCWVLIANAAAECCCWMLLLIMM